MIEINQIIANLDELDTALDNVVSADDLIVLNKIKAVADKFKLVSRRLNNAGFDTKTLDETLNDISTRAEKIAREFN